MLGIYCNSICSQIFFKRIGIYFLYVLVTSMYIVFGLLMNAVLSAISASEFIYKDILPRSKKQTFFYSSKIYPKYGHHTRQYYKTTSKAQMTENYFDSLQQNTSMLYQIDRINSWLNEHHTNKKKSINANNSIHNERINNIVQDGDILFHKRAMINRRKPRLWFTKSRQNKNKVNDCNSYYNNKVKENNPWNRFEVLNHTNTLSTIINNDSSKSLPLTLSPSHEQMNQSKTKSWMNDNNSLGNLLQLKNKSDELILETNLTKATNGPENDLNQHLQFFCPQQTLPPFVSTSQMDQEFWQKMYSPPKDLLSPSKDNLLQKETMDNLDNLYKSYFQPKTVFNSVVRNLNITPYQNQNQNQSTVFDFDRRQNFSADVPSRPESRKHIILPEKLEETILRYVPSEKPFSMGKTKPNTAKPISYLISNQNLASKIVKAMRHLDKSILNYPPRIQYDLYEMPSIMSYPSKNYTKVIHELFAADRFVENNNVYK